MTFKSFRIIVLLGVLLSTAAVSLHQLVYSRNWTEALEVVIFPMNGDGEPKTDEYIQALSEGDFKQIDKWFEREAKRHNLLLETPVNVRLGPGIGNTPPEYPENTSALKNIVWGLKFRWWVFRNAPDVDSNLVQVRIFVAYHLGEENKPLQHSLGMQRGLLGLVHAFALPRQTSQNNIVIAHELLHTVGAIDKYEAGGTPVFPAGFANPQRTPLFPQRRAEIMAGTIPKSHDEAIMAESLRTVVINSYTAAEINWLQ